MIRIFRRRYIAFKWNPDSTTSKAKLLSTLRNKIVGRHIRFIKYNSNIDLAIVRCDHRTVDYLLSFLRDLAEEYDIKVIGISGTLKALRRKYSL